MDGLSFYQHLHQIQLNSRPEIQVASDASTDDDHQIHPILQAIRPKCELLCSKEKDGSRTNQCNKKIIT